MTTLALPTSTHQDSRPLWVAQPPSLPANILTIARRELRESIRSRWFILYTIAFTALGLSVSYISAASTGGSGLSGFGRTTAGLINLVLLVVPLMALTAGAGSIASDRERGMLCYLLAQPVSRIEVLLGKYIGLAGALFSCITLGLGLCALILAWKGETTRPQSLLWLTGLTFGLALGMLSVGMLLSTLARKASAAIGTAIFFWLTFVFATDLALMAGTLAFRIRIQTLFALALLNPLQVFKMWSLLSVEASLDILGPAGLYASEEHGSSLHAIFAACMAAWILLPLMAAGFIFSRRSPI